MTPGKGSSPRCVHCSSVLLKGATHCEGCGAELPDLRIGQVIAERYRIDSLLGAGGFGRVYSGTHLALGEPVAIKFLLAEWTARPEPRARFKREAVALARLRHPGIVAVHDFGEHNGELYMAMELVRGRPLSDAILRDGQPMSDERLIGLAEQVIQVLESAHAEGIVHRDLKGENVMLLELADRSDRVKVLDFGLALMTEEPTAKRLTATQAVQGTPVYMSPEQCRGRDVGPATDIYAMGVLLFEMLAGAVPFDGSSTADVMVKHLFVDPPRVADRGVKRAVPEALEALVKWALAKSATDRPTAAQFREALAQASAGTDASSRAEKSDQARSSAAGQSREQRALGAAVNDEAPTREMQPGPLKGDGEGPRVLLWGFSSERASALATTLAVNGMVAVTYGRDELPPAAPQGHPLKMVAICAGEKATERVRSVRQSEALARVPTVVLELPDMQSTAALIRAGASDVAYTATRDQQLCQQLWKLLRRSP